MTAPKSAVEDLIADLRGRIGYLEAMAAERINEIGVRAEEDKNRVWDDMLAKTRELRAHVAHFEADLALQRNITLVNPTISISEENS